MSTNIASSVVQPTIWQERRGNRRYEVKLPVQVTLGNGTCPKFDGVTRNLSMDGAFFYTACELQKGLHIEFHTTLPCDSLLGRQVPLRFFGKVVRVERVHPHGFGVAVAF